MGSGAAVSEIPRHTRPGRELILETSITLLGLSSSDNELEFDWARSEEIFELDGPIPRLFQSMVHAGINEWRETRDNAIANLTYATLMSALQAALITRAYATDRLSHKLFLIRRKNLDESFAGSSGQAMISIDTKNVEKKLVRRLIQLRGSRYWIFTTWPAEPP
jgi:hypothetical protein